MLWNIFLSRMQSLKMPHLSTLRAETHVMYLNWHTSLQGWYSHKVEFKACVFHRFPILLPFNSDTTEMTKLEDEVLTFQLLTNAEIPDHVWQSVVVYQDLETKHYRMDILWNYLNEMKGPDGAFLFKRLASVALLVLTLPHSNAEEERVFSMVTKNKTKFRPSLKLDGTLSSILTVKLAKSEHCHKYDPPLSVLKSTKKATSDYNKAHSSKN